MAESPNRLNIALHKPIKDYIQEQQNKNTRVETRQDVGLFSEFLKQKGVRRKRQQKFKKSNQMSSTTTCANLQ